MTASTFQLHLHDTQNHSSSLTLYSHGKSAKPALLSCLAERKSGGKLAILPIKMTNGIGSGTSEPIDTSERQKENNQKRGHQIFVSRLQTSLSTNWKRSLSQENDQKASQKQTHDNEISSQNKKTANMKRNERNKLLTRGSQNSTSKRKDNNIHTSDNIGSNPLGARGKVGRKQENHLERQNSNVSIQHCQNKQLNFIIGKASSAGTSVASYSEVDLTSPCTSNVYIKSKSKKPNTVVVQKSPLCRSITISEASLSSAITRQANISSGNRSSSYRASRNTPRCTPAAISVQNKNKRSFTISNDTTDGRLRTIYESTMEDVYD